MKRALAALALLFFASPARAQVDTPSAPQAEAPPPPPPSPSPSPSPTPAPPAKWPTIIGARFDGGYATRRLFDIPITGADLGAAIGAQPLEHGAFFGTARVLVGHTEAGLSTWDLHVGAEGEFVLDRLRIGGGLGLFWFGLSRITASQTIRTWGPEVRAHARFDVVEAEGFAIFVRAAIQAGRELYDDATIWGPTVGAGVDFDLKGKRSE